MGSDKKSKTKSAVWTGPYYEVVWKQVPPGALTGNCSSCRKTHSWEWYESRTQCYECYMVEFRKKHFRNCTSCGANRTCPYKNKSQCQNCYEKENMISRRRLEGTGSGSAPIIVSASMLFFGILGLVFYKRFFALRKPASPEETDQDNVMEEP